MPPQSVEIAETILGLKRALIRDHRPASSETISRASNRGNKLKRGAQFVHQGALAYIKGPEVYKEKINHAGYTRYILQRNPPRYNKFGEELDASEDEDDNDAWSAEENAYSGLKLEDLLCPLKHPSELPVHPTLSHPYLSTAIPDMINSTNEQLRREKANLSRAKDLHRQLIGDEAWVPCEVTEAPEDWDIFEPRRPTLEDDADPIHGKKRKRDEDDPEEQSSVSGNLNSSGAAQTVNGLDSDAKVTEKVQDADTDMVDAEPSEDSVVAKETKDTKPKAASSEEEPAEENVEVDSIDGARTKDKNANGNDNGEVASDDKAIDGAEAAEHDDVGSDAASASPVQPTRRITRALAQTANTDSITTPPLSPTRSSTSSLSIHPLYLIRPLHAPPPTILANNSSSSLTNQQQQPTPYNLPPAEHSDTLSLLTSYIQKQSAFIAALNSVLTRLLQADRLRRTVFHWCKAEGHVGEMSDGEDWIDEEEWGLEAGELKKGKGDEEEIETAADGYLGRGKGKRRRAGG